MAIVLSKKKLVFIQTQAQPDESQFADVFPRYESFSKWYGFEDNHLVQACGVKDKREVEARQDVMELAEKTANALVG